MSTLRIANAASISFADGNTNTLHEPLIWVSLVPSDSICFLVYYYTWIEPQMKPLY